MVKVSVLVSLYNCINFLENFLNYAIQTEGKENIEFLLLHNKPAENEVAIINKYIDQFPHINHVIIPKLEGLYTTWNRGIKLAQGEYITIWNVDDIRFPYSIMMQAKVLDENPEAAIAYGDTYGSKVYGEQGNKLYNFPQFLSAREEFYRSYLMSCFQMWRKSIHDEIGYYDEQFICVGDFDFQIRTAINYLMVKAPRPLGIYLQDQPHKISSSPLHTHENNIVYLRYGAYEKIEYNLLPRSVKLYKADNFKFFGNWKANTQVSPFSSWYRIKGGLIGMFKLPYHIAKTTAKFILRRK